MSRPLQHPPSDNPHAAPPLDGPRSQLHKPGEQASSGAPSANGTAQPGPGVQLPGAAATPGRHGHARLGILAGLGAALVGAFGYAAVLRFTGHQMGYMVLVIGVFVGVAMGYIGRRTASPRLAAALSIFAVWLGQLVGMAWLMSHQDATLSFGSLFFRHFPQLLTDWLHSLDIRDAVFYALAGLDGFLVTRRMAARL